MYRNQGVDHTGDQKGYRMMIRTRMDLLHVCIPVSCKEDKPHSSNSSPNKGNPLNYSFYSYSNIPVVYIIIEPRRKDDNIREKGTKILESLSSIETG